MINICDFTMKDLDGFTAKDVVGNMDLYHVMGANIDNPYRQLLSLKDDEGLVCIAGMNALRPGVGELWLIPGVRVDKHKLEFYKTVKSLIYGYCFPELGLHRLEMAIKADWQKGIKWAKSLGFTMEGYMRNWNEQKEDHILFAKVVE